MSSSARGRGRITKRGNNRVRERPDDSVTEDPVVAKNTDRDGTNGGGNGANSEATWKKPTMKKVSGAQAERSTVPGQSQGFLGKRKESASHGQLAAAFPALAEATDRRDQTAYRLDNRDYHEMLIEKVLTTSREMNAMKDTMKEFCRAILVECGIEFDESLLEAAGRGDFEAVKHVIAEKRENEKYELNSVKLELEMVRKTVSTSDAAKKYMKYALNAEKSALQAVIAAENETSEHGNRPFSTGLRPAGFTPGRGMGGSMRGGFDRNGEEQWKRPRVSYAHLDEADEPAFEENW